MPHWMKQEDNAKEINIGDCDEWSFKILFNHTFLSKIVIYNWDILVINFLFIKKWIYWVF